MGQLHDSNESFLLLLMLAASVRFEINKYVVIYLKSNRANTPDGWRSHSSMCTRTVHLFKDIQTHSCLTTPCHAIKSEINY